MTSASLLKSTIKITLLTLVGIAFNFFVQLLIAYLFGTTFERDSYFAAIVIPNYIAAIITGSIGMVFLPKVIELNENFSQQETDKFVINLSVVLFGFLAIVIIAMYLFSLQLLDLTVSGFNQQQIKDTSVIFKVLLPTILFNSFANLLGSLYQIKGFFTRPAIAPIINSIFSLVFVFLFHEKFGIVSLAIGTLVGSFVNFIILCPIVTIKGIEVNITIIKRIVYPFIVITFPLFLGGIIFRSTTVFERLFASFLPTGGISFLGYSNQLLQILATVTSSGIAVSIFPLLSNYWNNDKELFVFYFNRGIKIILLITVPVSFIFLFWGDFIVKLIFERGLFDKSSTYIVSRLFSIMTIAFVASSLGGVIVKVFYITKKTIQTTVINCIEIIVYLVLAYYLSRKYGCFGMAWALTISTLLSIILSFVFVTKLIIKTYNYKELIIFIGKLVMSIILSFSIVFFVGMHIFTIESDSYCNLCLIVLFAITYVFLLYFFKVEEVLLVANKGLKYLRRDRTNCI